MKSVNTIYNDYIINSLFNDKMPIHIMVNTLIYYYGRESHAQLANYVLYIFNQHNVKIEL